VNSVHSVVIFLLPPCRCERCERH